MKHSKKQQDTIFVHNVLDFYKEYGRHDLMWRKKITPYKILVSEIMLQQTQVARVLEKFEVWIKLYPTLSVLKRASLQDILMIWQGLGYQRRAKSLYQIAQTTTKLSDKFEDLLLLPGIGPYTASAITSFAYNKFSHPMLETNIRTVLIEAYHQGEEDIHDGVLYDDVERLANLSLVQKVGARSWYYALMDYGAYLKKQKISHNKKSAHYTKQTTYKGSSRELRAKVLFAITRQEKLPTDERVATVLEALVKEGYIVKEKTSYKIKD